MKQRYRDLLGIGLLVAVRLAWSIEALLFDPFRFRNHEEAYNATVGWLVWNGDLWGELLRLQYRDFCGGCTVISILAAPTLGLLGDGFFVWKGLAMVWGASTVAMAAVAGSRLWGRPAGFALAALLAVPPGGLGELSLMLWGNHQETALLLMISLALLPRGGFALGLVLGLSLWFCRTGGYFVAVLLPLALSRPGRANLLAGVALGLGPMLLPAGAGASGQVSMSVGDHLLPEGMSGALKRLSLLLNPEALSTRLFLVRDMAWGAGLILCNAVIASIVLIRSRRFLPVVLAVSFLVVFAVSGFHVPLPGRVLPVVNARYHAPWMLLLMMLPAAAVVGRRSALLLVIPIGMGLFGRMERNRGPDYIPWEAPATNRWQFLSSGAVRLRDAPSDNGDSYLALLSGYVGKPVDNPAAAMGAGLAGGDGPGTQAARSVMQALRGQVPEHDFGRGFVLAERCQRPNPEAFCACVSAQDPGEVVLRGVGAATADPWRNPADLEALSACLGPAFTEGLAHPLAGIRAGADRY